MGAVEKIELEFKDFMKELEESIGKRGTLWVFMAGTALLFSTIFMFLMVGISVLLKLF